MIIRPIQKTRKAPTASQPGETIVSARIEFDQGPLNSEKELWFSFQSTDPDLDIASDADSFTVALLLVAMKRDEPLRIEGSISRRLWQGLQEYQQIYHQWFPDVFKVIEILPESFRDDPPSNSKNSACAFSGGVDSFYTFFELLKDQRVSHTVFMGGFDMPLNLKDSISELRASYSEMMKNLGIHFVTGSTNVRRFVNTVDWTNAHGQALIATALFFKSGWSQFFIPSSYTSDSYPKWGSHPSLDPLLSTESLQILHHGSEHNRVAKLSAIAQNQESFNRLRVCWIQDLGLKNCGACEKCIRTQIALRILGKLDSYTTFKTKLSSRTIRGLSQRTYQGRLFARELMKEALMRGHLSVWSSLAYSLLKRQLLFWKRNILLRRRVLGTSTKE